jgi:multicomponent Na+:H+ antiporter subunit A
MLFSVGLAACFAPLVVRFARGAAGWLLAILPAGWALYFASQLPSIAVGNPLTASWEWASSFGLALSFRADGLSALMALLISGIGALVVVFAAGYLGDHPHLGRFYAWLFIFMAAMLGVVLADHLLLVFVFWELTSLSSFMLIGFEHDQAAARAAALQALLVTGAGGLALLAGLVLLGQMSGATSFSALLAGDKLLTSDPLYVPALLLILLGAFTKSAQFPFHFWLPNAMAAPTPISAYLHSATMVKAGIYLLARLVPLLGGTSLWTVAVGGVGAVTMLLGAVLVFSQTDLKRILAYSTINMLGALVLLIGLGTPHALEAAAVLLLAHALYKCALFLVAGAVDHETGTRDVRRLSGLYRHMPLLAVAAAVAAASMAGLPPLWGFIAKELAYEAAAESGALVLLMTGIGFVATVFTAGLVGVGPFWGRGQPAQVQAPHVHHMPVALWLPPALLAGLSLLAGLLPNVAGTWLAGPAAAAMLDEPVTLKLALWHGFTPILLLSGITIAAGAVLYLLRARVRELAQRLTPRWGASQAYDAAVREINLVAQGTTRLVQSGYLRHYLITLMLVATGLIGFTLLSQGALRLPAAFGEVRFYELGPIALILLGTLLAISTRSRLTAAAGLGVTGFGVSLIYLFFAAPDLAMTQFLIESLTVILFVLAFYHLPRFVRLSATRARLRDALIALLVGGLMTALVLSARGVQLFPSIVSFFNESAYTLAHGRNITNVILVDFRGIDTLGEVTVLSIAAIGIYALLKLRKEGQR